MLLKACHRLGIPIAHDKLWHHVMLDPNIEKQLCQVESCHDYLSWSHFCQLGKLINYHEDGIHSIPLG
jgi:hypothetical protein